MFIMSFKSSKWVVGVIAIIAVLGISFAGFSFFTNRSEDVNTELIVNNNEQRVSFIQTQGWTVNADATEVVEVVVPTEFDEVYSKYNKLQNEQDFDLEKYKGKRVKRWSYEVHNHPKDDGYIRANLIVYQNKIIAADICSLKLNGFMEALVTKKQY